MSRRDAKQSVALIRSGRQKRVEDRPVYLAPVASQWFPSVVISPALSVIHILSVHCEQPKEEAEAGPKA